jgi:hypothetical protein
MTTNQMPVRPASRDAVYDIIDGERDYQDGKYPQAQWVEDYLALIVKYSDRIVVAKEGTRDNLRKIAALAIRAMEGGGALPRAWHVPASANITGTLSIRDPGDKLAPKKAA